MVLTTRHRELIAHLWRESPQSRTALAQRTGIRPNTIGQLVAELLELGVLREGAAGPSTGGRPVRPLEIDPDRCHVVGLALLPGQVGVCRLNLRGMADGPTRLAAVAHPSRMVPAARQLLTGSLSADTVGVGLTATGFIDAAERTLLFSSSVPGQRSVSLEPIFAAADCPVFLDNDMHATAASWMLSHRARTDQDILLVRIADGSLGAAVIVGGRPVRGCVTSANELGHMRFPVETDPCYCGHVGCLERIVSTGFLQRTDPVGVGDLAERARLYDGQQQTMGTLVGLLALGITNAVNFVRPHRLVVACEYIRFGTFRKELSRRIRDSILPELNERVTVDLWDPPIGAGAETAGWLALAGLYCEGW